MNAPQSLLALLGASWESDVPVVALAWGAEDATIAFAQGDGHIAVARAQWIGGPRTEPREGGGVTIVPAEAPPEQPVPRRLMPTVAAKMQVAAPMIVTTVRACSVFFTFSMFCRVCRFIRSKRKPSTLYCFAQVTTESTMSFSIMRCSVAVLAQQVEVVTAPSASSRW